MADRNKSAGSGGIAGGSNAGPGDSAENGKRAGPEKHGSSDGNNLPADERMVLIHGFSRDETIAVMRAAKTAVSDPQGVAFTTSTPTNLEWKLRDLIVEVRDEHEFMRRNPPGATGRPQQTPPGSDQAGGAGRANQPGPTNQPGQAGQAGQSQSGSDQAGQPQPPNNPQASNQKGGPDGHSPSAPGKDR